MPLEKGKSREAFEHNVREMVKAGHPQKQALAAAYREQRSDSSEPAAREHLSEHRRLGRAYLGGG